MCANARVLTDVSAGLYEDASDWTSSDGPALSGAKDWRIAKRRLKGGVSDGVDVIEVHNGTLAFSVLPTRGMGLWRGTCEGTTLGWNSPVQQPVHPAFVNAHDRGGLGWLAGFNEWLCRCGLSSFGPPGLDQKRDAAGHVVAEWPLTLHGKIANLAAHRVAVEVDDAGSGVLRVTGEVDEASLFGPRLRLSTVIETVAGSRSVTVRDTITNLGGQAAEVAMLYHINLGQPILEGGARVALPFRTMSPRDAHAAEDLPRWDEYLPPTAGYREQCYLFEPAADDEGRALALLRNANGDRGAAVRFNKNELPFFTVWKNTQAEADGYVTGLEPGTGFPNLRSVERQQGRLISLPPGANWSATVQLDVLSTAAAVREVEQQIDLLQSRCHPTIHQTPVPQWIS